MTSLIISYDITEESFVAFVTIMLSSNLLIYCYSSILTSGASMKYHVKGKSVRNGSSFLLHFSCPHSKYLYCYSLNILSRATK